MAGWRVLEVGCGEGAMGEVLRARGCSELTGIEPHGDAARRAASVFDRVHAGTVEDVLPELTDSRRFDLIVCADVLEHLVDPWAVVRALRNLAAPGGTLAVSIPNIRYLPALLRIGVGRGFEYEESGIFDRTHLRFFTRRDITRLLLDAGWTPRRWATPPPGRLAGARRLLSRATRQLTDEWGTRQWYAVATNDR